MKSVGIYSYIKSILLVVMSVFLIAVVFPGNSMFGYEHQILSSTNPDLYVTITAMPLFNVIADSFYSISLKFGYISLFVLEVLSIILCVALSLMLILKKENISKVFFVAPQISLLLLEILIICLFNNVPSILLVSGIFLSITSILFVLDLVFKVTKIDEKYCLYC